MAVRNLRPPTGAVGLRSFWDEFVLPIGRHMVPGTGAAVDAFGPDVVVADQHALAGPAVALRTGLPWATSATSSADLVDPLAGLPKVAGVAAPSAWRGLLVDAGVDPATAAAVDPRFSPHLVLAFTSAELVGAPEAFPDHWALVGPALAGRADDTPFPWDWLDGDRPTVLVTLGTVNWRAGARFFAAAAEALGGLDVRGIVVAPPSTCRTRRPTCWWCRGCRSWRCCGGSTWSWPTAATTPCARPSRPAFPWCWRRCGTTSRSWPTRWCGPAPASG